MLLKNCCLKCHKYFHLKKKSYDKKEIIFNNNNNGIVDF